MSQTVTDDAADFLTELAREEVAPKTIAAYRADLTHLGQRSAGSTDEAFAT
jgi:hypothetical protein